MTTIQWVDYQERLVGHNSPIYPNDVINRPLRSVLSVSGVNPDADFNGFVVYKTGSRDTDGLSISGVNAGGSAIRTVGVSAAANIPLVQLDSSSILSGQNIGAVDVRTIIRALANSDLVSSVLVKSYVDINTKSGIVAASIRVTTPQLISGAPSQMYGILIDTLAVGVVNYGIAIGNFGINDFSILTGTGIAQFGGSVRINKELRLNNVASGTYFPLQDQNGTIWGLLSNTNRFSFLTKTFMSADNNSRTILELTGATLTISGVAKLLEITASPSSGADNDFISGFVSSMNPTITHSGVSLAHVRISPQGAAVPAVHYGLKIDDISFGTAKYAISTGAGIVSFGDSIQFPSANLSTGSGSAALGANSPAVNLTAPAKWIKVLDNAGLTLWIPAWA